MTALFFLALFAAAVVFGWWLGTCWARAGREIDTVLGEHRNGWDVNDGADMSETASDWGGEL